MQQLGTKRAQSASLNFPLTIKVTDSTEPRVDVLPGGFIFISLGAVLTTHDESELATLMAHLIAHEAMPVIATNNSGAMPMTFLATGCARFVPRQAVVYATALTPAQSDEHERQIDELALQYLQHAGYNPAGAIVDTSQYEDMREKLVRMLPKHVQTTLYN
jgi:predicted Zn-dependent protease